jgi:hypothetical protein
MLAAWQVRDQLTTEHEQQLKARGLPGPASSLKRDAVMVDAIVSTIGFPLVGGPAGESFSMLVLLNMEKCKFPAAICAFP